MFTNNVNTVSKVKKRQALGEYKLPHDVQPPSNNNMTRVSQELELGPLKCPPNINNAQSIISENIFRFASETTAHGRSNDYIQYLESLGPIVEYIKSHPELENQPEIKKIIENINGLADAFEFKCDDGSDSDRRIQNKLSLSKNCILKHNQSNLFRHLSKAFDALKKAKELHTKIKDIFRKGGKPMRNQLNKNDTATSAFIKAKKKAEDGLDTLDRIKKTIIDEELKILKPLLMFLKGKDAISDDITHENAVIMLKSVIEERKTLPGSVYKDFDFPRAVQFLLEEYNDEKFKFFRKQDEVHDINGLRLKRVNIIGDGDCCFRTVSKCLFNDETKYYVNLRKIYLMYLQKTWKQIKDTEKDEFLMSLISDGLMVFVKDPDESKPMHNMTDEGIIFETLTHPTFKEEFTGLIDRMPCASPMYKNLIKIKFTGYPEDLYITLQGGSITTYVFSAYINIGFVMISENMVYVNKVPTPVDKWIIMYRDGKHFEAVIFDDARQDHTLTTPQIDVLITFLKGKGYSIHESGWLNFLPIIKASEKDTHSGGGKQNRKKNSKVNRKRKSKVNRKRKSKVNRKRKSKVNKKRKSKVNKKRKSKVNRKKTRR
jgi:hypothetical protein